MEATKTASRSKKDEAYNCIAIAKGAITAGKSQKAKAYLLRAQRLYRTAIAEELLASINDAVPSAPGEASVPSAGSSGFRRRTLSHRSPQISYSPKQEKAVRDVLICKDYYELLGITKEATATDIKKAYKKLSLRVHPDKNQAPGANEAFKKLNKAKDVLTNPELRRQYDNRGVPDESNTVPTPKTTYDISRRDADQLATVVTVAVGALLGGYLAYNLLQFIKMLWNGPQTAVIPAKSAKNSTKN